MSELNRIVKQVSYDTIDMKYMERFKYNLPNYRNMAEKIALKEYKQIYINNISLGEEITKLFSKAENKYKENTEKNIETYKQIELRCHDVENQNIELKNDIRDLKAKIKKEHDYKKKQVLKELLKQRELVISLNTLKNSVSIDNCRASLLAQYDIFKDLAEQVNNSFNPFDSKTNKDRETKIIELIQAIAGVTNIGPALTIASIVKAITEFIDSYNYIPLEDNRIDSINEEYQLQRKKCIDYELSYLALKFYLEDWDYIEKFCNNAEGAVFFTL